METGAPQRPFAFNCDIATPMERDLDETFAVDLFADVLVRADARSFYVGDEDEFEEALSARLLSQADAAQATRGVTELIQLVEADDFCPG